MSSYRALSSWEKGLIQRLLSSPFPGRDELLNQVEKMVASPMHEDGTPLDENNSLYLKSSSPVKAFVRTRVPTEGEAIDIDGVTIHYLLHVVEGRIDQLEIFKDDLSKVSRQPEPEDIKIIIAE
jgi:hypothetical protein